MLQRFRKLGNLLGAASPDENAALLSARERPELLGVGLDELRQHFDAEFYLGTNSDVAAVSADPFEHYLEYGWREGREPFGQFFSTLYEHRVPISSPEVCPLAGYVVSIKKDGGSKESSSTSSAADSSSADRGNDVLRTDASEVLLEDIGGGGDPEYQRVSPLNWYGNQDPSWSSEIFSLLRSLGHRTTELEEIPLANYVRTIFDPDFVRDNMGLGDEIGDSECFVRYLMFGLLSGMSPSPFFHEATYRRRAEKRGLLEIGKEAAFVHFLKHGLRADISPSPLFSNEDYVSLNRDLVHYPGPKLFHFINHGLEERRQFSSLVTIAHGDSGVALNSSRKFFSRLGAIERAHDELGAAAEFRESQLLTKILADAHPIDPYVMTDMSIPSFVPPWHDQDYVAFNQALEEIPEGEFDAVVLIPFCKVGGSDYVAGVLSRSLSRLGKNVLVVQTDQSDWHRSDWFGNVSRLDLSEITKGLSSDKATRLLYEVLRAIRPKNTFNVNSRLTFETFNRFGRQLKTFTGLHAYYFCADRTPSGDEAGYPVWYFSAIFEHLTTAITDSKDLSNTLTKRFMLMGRMADRVTCVYTPSKICIQNDTLAERQLAGAAKRERPRIMWAGRFDRQKRFDLLLDVAREMPDVDFWAWGKAVLDSPPDLSELPSNVTLHEPFTSYDELPLEDVDGFFYTSDWDGVPTILIELGGLGMPLIASASGGVPELINDKTGWPVPVGSPVKAYADAIKAMMADTEQRTTRSKALREKVRRQHSQASFDKKIAGLLK